LISGFWSSVFGLGESSPRPKAQDRKRRITRFRNDNCFSK
jgi:hypothetical protein